MKSKAGKVKWSRPVKGMIAASLILFLSIGSYILYRNINRLLLEALMRSFQSSLASDVYELKLEGLRVNIFERNVQVSRVVIQPRSTPLSSNYPYINSSFRLTAEELVMKKVEIFTLLQSNRLKLENILLVRPTISAELTGAKPIFLPFEDSGSGHDRSFNQKRAIESFDLREFQLVDAHLHIVDKTKLREFSIARLNVSLGNLLIDQRPGEDFVSLDRADLSMGQFDGFLKNEAIRRVGFKNFRIGLDSLSAKMRIDTAIFRFHDFNAGVSAVDVQTADSLFHLVIGSFDLSYKERSMLLNNLSFKPNISNDALQRRFKYQHTQAAGTVESIGLNQVDFNSLIHQKALFIDEVVIVKPIVSIFKDNTKPVDKRREPTYFGQQIRAIPLPIWIKKIHVMNINLTNVERKKDGDYASVKINRGTAEVKNVSNHSKNPLTIKADAYIENKVHFDLLLGFSYLKPEFSIVGSLGKFELTDLNPVITAYTPAKIHRGVADEIRFSGIVYRTRSEGTMTFLYNDLKVDLEMKDKAKWKSSVLGFVANAIVYESNPNSSTKPPRIVKFHAVRDMNKGFVNIVLKSALAGVQETLIMSKENRKAYMDAKKEMRQSEKK